MHSTMCSLCHYHPQRKWLSPRVSHEEGRNDQASFIKKRPFWKKTKNRPIIGSESRTQTVWTHEVDLWSQDSLFFELAADHLAVYLRDFCEVGGVLVHFYHIGIKNHLMWGMGVMCHPGLAWRQDAICRRIVAKVKSRNKGGRGSKGIPFAAFPPFPRGTTTPDDSSCFLSPRFHTKHLLKGKRPHWEAPEW